MKGLLPPAYDARPRRSGPRAVGRTVCLDCRHQVEPDPTEMAERCGADTTSPTVAVIDFEIYNSNGACDPVQDCFARNLVRQEAAEHIKETY